MLGRTWLPMPEFPPLGSLLASAFDKALAIMASRWKLLVTFLAAASLLGLRDVRYGGALIDFFIIYWAYASYANVRRLDDRSYIMPRRTAVNLTIVQLGVTLATIAGLLLGVAHGI